MCVNFNEDRDGLAVVLARAVVQVEPLFKSRNELLFGLTGSTLSAAAAETAAEHVVAATAQAPAAGFGLVSRRRAYWVWAPLLRLAPAPSRAFAQSTAWVPAAVARCRLVLYL